MASNSNLRSICSLVVAPGLQEVHAACQQRMLPLLGWPCGRAIVSSRALHSCGQTASTPGDVAAEQSTAAAAAAAATAAAVGASPAHHLLPTLGIGLAPLFLAVQRASHDHLQHSRALAGLRMIRPVAPLPWGSHQLQQQRGAKTKVIMEYHPLKEPKSDQYTSEPTNYLQLLGALQHADSTDRLKQLIQRYGGAFDAVLLAAAFGRLPKLAKYRSEHLMRAVPTTVPPGASPLQGRLIPCPGTLPRPSYRAAASSLAFQLMALTVGPSNVMLPKDASLSSPRSQPQSKTVAHGLKHGLSLWKLRCPPGIRAPKPATASKLVSAADLKDGEGLGDWFQPSQAAACIWALGTLKGMGVQMDGRLVGGTVEAALATLLDTRNRSEPALEVHGTAFDAAITLKGLALLQHRPRHTEHLQLLADFCRRRAGSFTWRNVQMALRSMVRLGHVDPPVVQALSQRAIALAGQFPPVAIANVLQALAAVQPALAAGSPSQQLPAADEPGPGSASLADDDHNPAHAVLKALAAGVAPQLVLMTPADLAAMADSLAKLGPTASKGHDSVKQDHGSARAASQPAGLPAWLRSLAGLLADKAVRDISQLQPLQLASVLRMAADLQLPHASLLETVADGVLVEHQLDPQLPVAAGAALLQALATLNPLLPEPVLGRRKPPADAAAAAGALTPTIRTLLGHARKQAPPAPLRPRETAQGLGNLDGHGEPSELISAALGPLDVDTALVSEPDTDLPRQYYQRLLVSGAPLQEKAHAAAQRVLGLYTAPGALVGASLSELADMVSALRALGAWSGSTEQHRELVAAACDQAVVVVQAAADELKGDASAASSQRKPEVSPLAAATHLRSALQLLQQLRAAGQSSASLSAAVALYMKEALSSQPAAAPQLLPTCIQLLTACRQHGAEPISASKVVAQAYAGMLGQDLQAASPWPEHTASGLAPEPRRRDSPRSQPWTTVSGPLLAELLEVCAANNTLDEAAAAAAAAHLPRLLSKKGSNSNAAVSGDLDVAWMARASAALAQHAERAQQQNAQLSQSEAVLFETLVVQLTHRLQASRGVSAAVLQQLQELEQQLSEVADSDSQQLVDQVLQQLSGGVNALLGATEKLKAAVGAPSAFPPSRPASKPALSRQVLLGFQEALNGVTVRKE